MLFTLIFLWNQLKGVIFKLVTMSWKNVCDYESGQEEHLCTIKASINLPINQTLRIYN